MLENLPGDHDVEGAGGEAVRLDVAEDPFVERGVTVELPARHVDADEPGGLAKRQVRRRSAAGIKDGDRAPVRKRAVDDLVERAQLGIYADRSTTSCHDKRSPTARSATA